MIVIVIVVVIDRTIRIAIQLDCGFDYNLAAQRIGGEQKTGKNEV